MRNLAALIRKFFRPLKSVKVVYVAIGPKFTRLWVVAPVIRSLDPRAERAVARRVDRIQKLRPDLKLTHNMALVSIAEARREYHGQATTYCAFRRR